MHTGREDELIALAGELESELMRVGGEYEDRMSQLQTQAARQEHALHSALAQVESLKKQLRLHVDDMTAAAAPAPAAVPRRRNQQQRTVTATASRLSGDYGFPSPGSSGQGNATVAMVELRSLMRDADLAHVSTVSAPVMPHSRNTSSDTSRMARRFNRPARRGLLRRMRGILHLGRRRGSSSTSVSLRA